jgi:hypothetical protein
MMRAPIETSLSTKNRRFSNIFSKTRIVPHACVATATAIDVRSAGNAGQGPSSIFGTWSPRSFWITSSWSGGTRSQPSPSSTLIPSRVNAVRIDARSRGSTPSIVRSLLVTAARPMKLPTSMCSGAIAHSPPPRLCTPWIRRTFDSMPSICAPSETRKRQRSWTCGSHAALPIVVSPGARTAAITAFSVAITLASSRKIVAPRSPSVAIS